MQQPFAIGITGGTGSGKTWLAHALLAHLGPQSATLISQDWYYHDLSHLPPEQAAATNFDHPDAIEFELLENHLQSLLQGQSVKAPDYRFSSFSRAPDQHVLKPAPLIALEGTLILNRQRIRDLCSLTVFVDTPADIRLIRRIRRDLAERGYELERILDFWESKAHPMHARFVESCQAKAHKTWKSMEDRAFVPDFLADLEKRLASHADRKAEI